MNVPGGGNAQTIQLLIQVQANAQAAQQSAQVLNQAAAALDKTTKSALSLKQAGRDLREVGGTIAAAGVSILAPFVAAANQYEQKYARLEPIANAYAVAQKRQADATIQLGRVGAQALTPFLNTVADVEKKIADFATAHPDIVQAVVGGGAVLATAGAGLAAVGQVLVTVANAAKLLGVQASGVKTLFGNMATAAGSVGLAFAALQVAVPVTIAGLNAFGRAINDPRLAHLTLGDVLDTGSQVIKLALSGLVDVISKIVAGFALIKADIDHASDPNWNGANNVNQIKDLTSSITKAITAPLLVPGVPPAPGSAAANNIRPGAVQDAMLGVPATPEQQAAALDALKASISGKMPASGTPGTLTDPNAAPVWWAQPVASAVTDSFKSQLKGIDTPQELADWLLKNQADVQTSSPALQAFLKQANAVPLDQTPRDKYQASLAAGQSDFMKQFNAGLSGAGGSGGGSGSGGTGTDTTAETTTAFITMEKANAAADIQLAQQKLAAQTSYNQESLKLEKDREAQISVMLADQNRARLKAIADFNENEKMTEQKIQFERQQQLYTMGLQANELAIQGDVAGFISAQIQNRNTILEQDRQNAFDKTQRKEQFDFQQAQQAAADKVALDQQKAQFAREDAGRKTAYDDQLKALQVSNDNQHAENQRAFAEQYAAIVGNNTAVGLLYSNWMTDQESKAAAFVAKMNLVPTVAQTLGITVPNVNAPPPPNQQGAPIQTFALGGYLSRGWNMVGERGPEMIHGASGLVVPNRGSHGGMNITISPTINIGAGNNVSRNEVQEMFQEVATRIVNSIGNDIGLGMGATQ